MPRGELHPTARRTAAPGSAGRRSAASGAAGRPLWVAALWTGIGAAAVAAVCALLAVAVLWLPVSGHASAATTTGGDHANSTIRAGLLTFLAALHGGVTVDGSTVLWLPLGMTLLVGLICRRAGTALADAADELQERGAGRLVRALLAQAAAFTVAALVAVPFARLGTSSASPPAVALAAPVVFLVFGGWGFVRATPLRGAIAAAVPRAVTAALRTAAAVVCVQLAAGAVLVAGALVVHRDAVRTIAGSVGTGWSSVPVLLLCVLAVPNAVIAGSAYLLGPGFAVGAGTDVQLFAGAHGTLPAFPLLGALPTGNGGSPAAVSAALATVLLAGIVGATVAARAERWPDRLATALGASVVVAAVQFLLAWQAGGGIGAGRLRAVGPSPWQLGAAAFAETVVVCLAGLGLLAAWRFVRSPVDENDEVGFLLAARRLVPVPPDAADPANDLLDESYDDVVEDDDVSEDDNAAEDDDGALAPDDDDAPDRLAGDAAKGDRLAG